MTDEPATTPAADRVTALTLRCGQLREQRDEARRERDAAAVERDEMAELYDATIGDQLRDERDHARAQVVACQTAADDLRATMQALAAEWDRLATSRSSRYLGACATQVRAALETAPDGAGSVHRDETGAEVATGATPDLLGPQIGAEQ